MISGFGVAGSATHGQGAKANGKTLMSFATRVHVN